MQRIKPWERYGMPPPKSEASKGELSLVDYEIYSGIEVPDGPFFVRLDGWSFHALSKKLRFEKPFDSFYAGCLSRTALAFFELFNPSLAYIFSDEINILFLSPASFRRIEKIDSVFAGFASTAFFKELSKRYAKLPAIAFDCRVIPIEKALIIPYLVWRQAECFRNFNNAYAQHVLLEKGFSPKAASKKLAGKKTAELRAIISERYDIAKIPAWQERGILVYKMRYKKRGYDPIKKISVIVERKKAVVDKQPPRFSSTEGATLIKRILEDAHSKNRLS